MCFKNTKEYYGAVAKSLHWLVFAAFVVMFIVAEIMMGMVPAPENTFVGYGKWDMYAFHKSLGMLLLAVIFIRVAWRFMNQTPAIEPKPALWQRLAAGVAHIGLYVVMFALPLSGYLMSMAGGHGIEVFGIWQVPDLVGKNPELARFGHEVHEISKFAVFILVGVHILGALHHHYIAKDNTLTRMLPRRS